MTNSVAISNEKSARGALLSAYRKIPIGIRVLPLFVLAFPFIQLGYSVYLSVQLFSFLLLIGVLWLLRAKILIMDVLIIALCMLPSVFFFFNSPNFIMDLLRVGREALNLLVLLSALSTFRRQARILAGVQWFGVRQLKLALAFVSLAILAFTLAQLFFINVGYRFWLPLEWYAMRDNVLPTELSLLYTTNLRPSSFFTEPSYQGFISVSLLLAVWAAFNTKNKWAYVACLLANVFLARTTSGGVLFLALLCVLYALYAGQKIALEKRTTAILFLILIIGAFITIVVFSGVFPIFDKIVLLFDGSQTVASASRRIFTPLKIIDNILWQYPFGAPPLEIERVLRVGNAQIFDTQIDNAILMLFAAYGLLAAPLLAYVAYRIKSLPLTLYFLFAANFNGAIFFYEKTVVLVVAMAIFILYNDVPRASLIGKKRPANN